MVRSGYSWNDSRIYPDVTRDYWVYVLAQYDDVRPACVMFLQDGENDIDTTEGSWPMGNMNMAAALRFARYDHRFEMGTGGHDLKHGGAIFPDTLRWDL